MPFKPPAPKMIPARWKGGAQVPALLVIHSMVAPCKAGVAESIGHMFATETNKTSAHYGIDPETVIQYVGDHAVAFHCGYNDDSIGLEMADMPGPVPGDKPGSARFKMLKKSWRWIRPEQTAMLKRTATLAAQLCLAYDIPVRFLRTPGLQRWAASGRKAAMGGITIHALMSSTFHESVHWDPGWWPRYRFMRLVRAEVKRLKALG